MSLAFYDDAAERDFRAAGLDTLEALCASSGGQIVTTASTRICRRLELSGSIYYVKTQDLARARLPLRKLPSYLLRGSPIVREQCALRVLEKHGFAIPAIVAGGGRRSRGVPRQSALVTRAVPEHTDLATWCATAAADDDGVARGCFDAVEACVARAHDAGLVLLGAKYRNFLIPDEGCSDARHVVLIDQPNLRESSSRRLREKDRRLLALDRHRYGRGR